MTEKHQGNGRTDFGIKYQQTLGRILPEYALFPLTGCFLWNIIVYVGTQFLTKNLKHYNLATELDQKIPFVSQWIIVYLICFVFWIVNYILIGREGKEKCFRFVTADLISRCICGVIFIIFPTTNIRPIVESSQITDYLVRFVYTVDNPANLFPSIHCLVSWFCFIGIRKSKKIPTWYKVFSCLFAMLVFVATQFTKQHYLTDVVGGVFIAEVCYYVTNHTESYKVTQFWFEKLQRVIFGEIKYEK